MLLPINRLGVPICPRERRRRDISSGAPIAQLGGLKGTAAIRSIRVRQSVIYKSTQFWNQINIFFFLKQLKTSKKSGKFPAKFVIFSSYWSMMAFAEIWANEMSVFLNRIYKINPGTPTKAPRDLLRPSRTPKGP